MKKIVVFTNWGKLFAVKQSFAKRSDVKNFGLPPKAQLLFFHESDNQFSPANDFSLDGLYFLCDEVTETVFENLIEEFNQKDFLILKHSQPKYIAGFINVREGMHASSENGGIIYPDVVGILQDDKENKTDRIFKIIFRTDLVKELKIELIKSIQRDELPDTLRTELKEFQAAYDNFKKHAHEDCLSRDYTESFENLLNELKIED